MKKWMNNNKLLLIMNALMILYTSVVWMAGDCGWFFGKQVNIAFVLLIMFILELGSTLTFQLRLKLTAKFEDDPVKNRIYHIWVPIIAGLSWLIAGIQGVLLIGGTETFIDFLLKMPPVFIATFNGVYLNMLTKKK